MDRQLLIDMLDITSIWRSGSVWRQLLRDRLYNTTAWRSGPIRC